MAPNIVDCDKDKPYWLAEYSDFYAVWLVKNVAPELWHVAEWLAELDERQYGFLCALCAKRDRNIS